MDIYTKNGKDQKSLLEEILKENNLSEKDIIFKIEETKTGLFKTTNYQINVAKLDDILEFIKNYLTQLFEKMSLQVNFESSISNNQIYLKMSSNNNAILIGKNGQTLNALQTIIRQVIIKEIGMLPYILLDVENYKDSQIDRLENVALKIAKEVSQTGIDARLENMNSYERRIVHNRLSSVPGITTVSEGEEPNRHIIIKKIHESKNS